MRATQDKILRALLYALGAVATVAFVITKSPGLLDWATSGGYKYGDLYRICEVKDFKPARPLPFGDHENEDSFDQHSSADGKDVLLIGDSFSFCDWGKNPYWMQLSQQLGRPIFSVYNNHHPYYWTNPCALLGAQAAASPAPKVLVYEIVERSVPAQFSLPVSTNSFAPSPEASRLEQIANDIFANTDERHKLLLKHNFFMDTADACLNTLAFEHFKHISSDTPWYSLHPPFLFYGGEVSCFQSKHDDAFVDQLADNVALLDRTLSERFNCTLVFVPLPNKVTLYSKLAGNEKYDDFLPRLCAALKRRGVRTVEVLPEFQKQSELLYWPTDTHWNDLGINIAVRQTLAMFPPGWARADH
jgi:hypothetical protein